jgi:hypothetical protein
VANRDRQPTISKFFGIEGPLRVHLLRVATGIVLASALSLSSSGQQALDPTAAFEEIRERLLADLSSLPRYTCVQAITRKYFETPTRQLLPRCSALIAAHDTRKRELSLEAWDRLRLEVAIVGNHSVYSWVGAPRFEEGVLEKLGGRGPLGSGDFGFFLEEILRRAIVSFQGEEFVNGQRLLKFSYDVPIGRTGYNVKMDRGWVLTAYSGTFRLAADNADIEGLTVRTAALPPGSNTCLATSEVDYGRTLIHDRKILIPRETRLLTINPDGSETSSVTTYASCREYASNSRMLLQAPANSAGTSAESPQAPPSLLPADLRFRARIVTSIDSSTAWAGDPVEAILRAPMRDAKHNVVAPAGAHLHGRLVRVEQQSEPSDRFKIAIVFESIEINGRAVPMRATRDDVLIPAMPPRSSWTRSADDDRFDGIGTFSFPGNHVHLEHLDSEWVTVTPSVAEGPGEDKP